MTAASASHGWRRKGAPLSNRDLLAYALPSVGTAALALPVSIYLGAFYAEVLGVGLAAIGLILVSVRVWDVLTDLAIGHLSDNLVSRWGRRRPLIALATPLTAAAVWLLFVPPVTAGLTYFVVTIYFLYVGWTLLAINHHAWAAELSLDYDGRTRLLGWAQFAGLAASSTMLILPAVLEQFGDPTLADRMRVMAQFIVASIAVGNLGCLLLLRESRPERPPGNDLGRLLRATLANRLLLRVLVIGVFLFSGGAAISSVLLFYIDDVAGLGERSSTLVAMFYLSAMLSVPLWIRFSHAVGKHRALCASMLLFIVAAAMASVVPAGVFWLFTLVIATYGAAFGPVFFIIPAIIADLTDVDNLHTGTPRAATFYAIGTLAYKIGFAVGFGVAFPLLEWLGYDPGAPARRGGIDGLRFVFLVVPSLLFATVIALAWKFPLDRREQARLRDRIDARDQDREPEAPAA